MRICFFNNYDVSPNTGGVNRVTYNLTVSLSQRTVKCYLAYLEDNRMPAGIYEAKIKLPDLRQDAARFKAFLKEHRIDVLHINYLIKKNLYALPYIYHAAQDLGIPVVQAFHVSPDYELNGFSSWNHLWFNLTHGKPVVTPLKHFIGYRCRALLSPLYHQLLKRKYSYIYQNNDILVLLSQRMEAAFMRYVNNQNKRVTAIANPNTFDSSGDLYDINAKRKEVLIVARLDEQHKRLSLALKIWRIVEPQTREWTLVLVGNGKDEAYYKHLVTRYGLKRVRFEGFQPPAGYYRSASLFMMTSSSEGWPMTLCECMQYGVVPLAFDSFFALKDMVVDGESGVIVKDRDIRTYAERLMWLMAHDEERLRMADNARISVKRFDTPVITDQWIKLYESLLQRCEA